MQVRWKQFAIDFDDFPMPLKAHSLPTTYYLGHTTPIHYSLRMTNHY